MIMKMICIIHTFAVANHYSEINNYVFPLIARQGIQTRKYVFSISNDQLQTHYTVILSSVPGLRGKYIPATLKYKRIAQAVNE